MGQCAVRQPSQLGKAFVAIQVVADVGTLPVVAPLPSEAEAHEEGLRVMCR